MNPGAQLVIKRLSVLFYSIFKVFLILNLILLALSLYNIKTDHGSNFLFVMFLMNFWIMMLIFSILSMYIKLFLCVLHQDMVGDNSLYSIIFFPLVSEEDEDEFIRLISQQSFEEDQPPSSSPTATQPPTIDRLNELETRWKHVWNTHPPVLSTECLICSHPQHFEHPTHKGCVRINCCPSVLHKKCILEWFHFCEKTDQHDETKYMVSCPSCRHIFIHDM